MAQSKKLDPLKLSDIYFLFMQMNVPSLASEKCAMKVIKSVVISVACYKDPLMYK